MTRNLYVFAFSVVLAWSTPGCAQMPRPIVRLGDAPVASLWQPPTDLQARDLVYGPWGATRAPGPDDVYTLVEHKHTGVNPGMTVRDSRGRKWSVKQTSPDALAAEGPIEVVLSRVLSAVGYHQPPVHYLPSFTLRDDWGARTTPGGRFRLSDETLDDRGTWLWEQNPFVETRPYKGLLVILLMFNSSDLKSDNNTLYEYHSPDGVRTWYVVRDLGTALGETGRVAPRKGDPDLFERSRFIIGVKDGFVQFDYHGWHRHLITGRIRPADVEWACGLLSGLTDRQWQDAFRAGGFPTPVADRFIRKLLSNIALGRALNDDPA